MFTTGAASNDVRRLRIDGEVAFANFHIENSRLVVEGDFTANPPGFWMKNTGTAGEIQLFRADQGGAVSGYIVRDTSSGVWLFKDGSANTRLWIDDSDSVGVKPGNAGLTNLGDATHYWNDISYKTLTDRGCLGWFDEGVELQDGRIVSDCEALASIEKHPTKKTVYGVPMLNYKTLPKVSYRGGDDTKTIGEFKKEIELELSRIDPEKDYLRFEQLNVDFLRAEEWE
jgi:hypothetical protein